MRHTWGRIFISFMALQTCMLPYALANSKSKPIEVLSDPENTGRPTKYSILKGTTLLTFTRPYRGQFTRAEISTRNATGNVLTRFLITSDGRNYRPILRMETPFARHLSARLTSEPPVCEVESQPISMMNQLVPGLNRENEIQKTKNQMAKAGFFQASCFDPALPEPHREAMMLAAAEVFTLDRSSPSKFLTCLEANGFSHESGLIQAQLKQSITEKALNPKLRMSCSTDSKAPAADYSEETQIFSLKKARKPERDPYAQKVFHELLHGAKRLDHAVIAAAENCCAEGVQCDVLRNFAKAEARGERVGAIRDVHLPSTSSLASTVTVLSGLDKEAAQISNLKVPESISIENGMDQITAACEGLTEKVCAESVRQSVANYNSTEPCPSASSKKSKASFINILIDSASAIEHCLPETDCDWGFANAAVQERQINQVKDMKVAERAEIPQSGPLDWSTPAGVSPLQQTNISLRAPASAVPLPTVEIVPERAESKSAASIVETMSRAADKVGRIVTPTEVEHRKVEPLKILTQAAGKQFSGLDNQFVTASFASMPLVTADFSKVDFSVANPFFNMKSAAAKSIAAKAPTPVSAGTTGKDAPSTKRTVASTVSGKTTINAEGDVGVASAPKMNANTNNSASPLSAFGRPTQNSNADGTRKIKSLSQEDLVKIIVSSYQSVVPYLKNDEFIETIKSKGIRIEVPDKKPVGSEKPKLIFVFDTEKKRFIQKRGTN